MRVLLLLSMIAMIGWVCGCKDSPGTLDIQGVPGEPGEPGKDGEKGDRGEKGEPGTISNSNSGSGSNGSSGSSGSNGSDGNSGSSGSSGGSGSSPQRGERGLPGPPGPPGPAGPPGPVGQSGEVGLQGLPGEPGNNCQLIKGDKVFEFECDDDLDPVTWRKWPTMDICHVEYIGRTKFCMQLRDCPAVDVLTAHYGLGHEHDHLGDCTRGCEALTSDDPNYEAPLDGEVYR